MQGEVLHHLFERVNLVAHADETYDVAGNAAGESDEVLLGPVGKRNVPGKSDQPGIRLRREEPGHGPILSSLDSCRRAAGIEQGCFRLRTRRQANYWPLAVNARGQQSSSGS